MGTNLQRTPIRPSYAPVVVEVEADQTKNSEFEEDFPSRYQASETVQHRTPIANRTAPFNRRTKGQKDFGKLPYRVALAKLIRKQDTDAKDPSGERNPGYG